MALISSDLPRENSATKGDVQSVFAQFVEQLRDAQIGLRVAQLVFREPSPEGFEAFRQLGAPSAVGGELLASVMLGSGEKRRP
jgi:hypothetical protein